jgi:hypothetical protein
MSAKSMSGTAAAIQRGPFDVVRRYLISSSSVYVIVTTMYEVWYFKYCEM